MKVISKQHNSKMCFICGMDNPIGLRAQFYNMEDNSVVTIFKFNKEHQSFPNRVHGGLIATMLDELGLRALWALKGETSFGVTTSLEVKYKKPVPYDVNLIGKGIVSYYSKLFVDIDTYIYDEYGTLLAIGKDKYMLLDVNKIASDVKVHEEMPYLIEDEVKEINFLTK